MTRIFLLCLLVTSMCTAQVGIGTTNPDNSSALDIVSTNAGVLIPRLTENQKTNVNNPVLGLLIFQTDAESGFWYYNGSSWVRLEQNDRNWSLTGNSGTDASTQFIGTSDNEDLIIKSNDTERIRVNDNSGNIGINTTQDNARLYVNVETTESVPNYGIRNDYSAGGSGTKYGIYNRNDSNSNGPHYGIYTYTTGGTGTKYGIYNQTTMTGASASSVYGLRNNINSTGLGTHFGQYNYLILGNSLTANAYGQYTHVDYSSGDRYGDYKRLLSLNTISGGTIYGDYSRIYGSGNEISYGTYNAMEITGNGLQYGSYNNLTSTGTGIKYGTFNDLDTTSSGNQYGTFNSLPGSNSSDKYGVYNNMYSDDGRSFGMYNLFWREGSEDKYGVYNQFGNAEGQKDKYGVYNRFVSSNSNGDLFGTFTEIDNSGLGDTFGLYVDVNGDTNDYAAYFNAGNVVSNPSGGNYDFKVGTLSRPNALFVDASANAVKFGVDLPSFADEGVTVGGTAIDYVASFYNGQSDGTTIGIGQNVYLLEGDFRLKVNAPVVAAYHLSHDLGYSTTEDAWDDVYADDFVNISDERQSRR